MIKQANELGIHDMSGNVSEWCSDWLGSYSSDSQINPKGGSLCDSRVLRGGNWGFSAKFCRVAYRFNSDPSCRSHYSGFRVVRVP